MNCDLNCPPLLQFFCCNGCEKKEFVVKCLEDNDLHDKWGKNGFRTGEGCAAGEDRPEECKEYNCKDYRFFFTVTFSDGKWQITGMNGILASKVDMDFLGSYNDLIRSKA